MGKSRSAQQAPVTWQELWDESSTHHKGAQVRRILAGLSFFAAGPTATAEIMADQPPTLTLFAFAAGAGAMLAAGRQQKMSDDLLNRSITAPSHRHAPAATPHPTERIKQ